MRKFVKFSSWNDFSQVHESYEFRFVELFTLQLRLWHPNTLLMHAAFAGFHFAIDIRYKRDK